jgi:hypothetical protein
MYVSPNPPPDNPRIQSRRRRKQTPRSQPEAAVPVP